MPLPLLVVVLLLVAAARKSNRNGKGSTNNTQYNTRPVLECPMSDMFNHLHEDRSRKWQLWSPKLCQPNSQRSACVVLQLAQPQPLLA